MTTQEKIMDYLKLKPLTANQISKHSKISRRAISWNLKALSEEGKIKPIGFGEKPKRGTSPLIWAIC